MNNRYIQDWDTLYARHEAWWAREKMDGPLFYVTAQRSRPLEDAPSPQDPGVPAKWLDADYIIAARRHSFAHTYYAGDSFPHVSANYGPGSLALYLGSEPVFADTTVWYKPCIDDLETTPLPTFNPENKWFTSHLALLRRVREAFGDDAFAAIPDIIESVDILSAMRDPLAFCYDLVDRPAACRRWLQRINDLYMPHYDAFLDICRAEGRSVFTAFAIVGPGKTCKVQCDFAAMMSPDQFAEFYVPYVTEQIARLDRTLYHLDGPDAVKHLDHLLGIEKLDAIQWVSGAGAAPNDDERWFPMYRKILAAGKGLQISVRPEGVEKVLRRIGARGVYLLTHVKTEREADELVAMTRRI